MMVLILVVEVKKKKQVDSDDDGSDEDLGAEFDNDYIESKYQTILTRSGMPILIKIPEGKKTIPLKAVLQMAQLFSGLAKK